MKADIKAEDRGELVSLMDPLVISDGSRHRGPLIDLAFDLTQKSAGFSRSLPPSLLVSLAHLVRAMNCYYHQSRRSATLSATLRADLREYRQD